MPVTDVMSGLETELDMTNDRFVIVSLQLEEKDECS